MLAPNYSHHTIMKEETMPWIQWISVKDLYPNDERSVIVRGEGGWKDLCYWNSYYKTWYDSAKDYPIPSEITHWMDLPEEPEYTFEASQESLKEFLRK